MQENEDECVWFVSSGAFEHCHLQNKRTTTHEPHALILTRASICKRNMSLSECECVRVCLSVSVLQMAMFCALD